MKDWADYWARFQETIPVTTLDARVGSRFDGKRVLIMIDVEGAEHQVLEGAQSTVILRHRPMSLVEICLSAYHPKGVNPDFARTFERVWNAGCSAWEMGDPTRRIGPEVVERWIRDGMAKTDVVSYLFSESHLRPPSSTLSGNPA